MKAEPLQTNVRDLNPARCVFVRRHGRVYAYPAAIVKDLANDFYVARPDIGEGAWNASPLAWNVGRLLKRRVGPTVDVDHLLILAREIWRSRGGCDATFVAWWFSVDAAADPEWIGAAACMAAGHVLSWPVFESKHLIDEQEPCA